MVSPVPLKESKVAQLLKSWRALHAPDGLNTLSEGQVKYLLNCEVENMARAVMLLRIHGRYNTLRTRREKSELLAVAKE